MLDNKTLSLTKDVAWVGVLDPKLKRFDIVMETVFGTTYNSYFINADKKTIIETTKISFWDVYLNKLKQLCKPSEIEYIVLNHTEPDHSGNIMNLLKIAPKAVVIGSGNAIKYLKALYGEDFQYKIVKDGDVIDLGNKKLHIIAAPNLHWPDSIFTYLEEDNILFTCDSFGAHYCHEAMFDDLVGDYDEALKYYFDVIIRPYSKFLLKAIEKIRPLDIKIIAPGHGPILRTHWKHIIDLSEKLSKDAVSLPNENRVFIPYVSAYQNTGMIAEKIAEGIRMAGNIVTDVCDVETMPIDVIEDKIVRCKGMIIGSPTINQNIMIQIYQIFALINPIRDRDKLAATFGSFGWSGEGEKLIESCLTNLKLKMFGNNIFVKFTPQDDVLNKCVEYGKEFGEKLLSLQDNNI